MWFLPKATSMQFWNLNFSPKQHEEVVSFSKVNFSSKLPKNAVSSSNQAENMNFSSNLYPQSYLNMQFPPRSNLKTPQTRLKIWISAKTNPTTSISPQSNLKNSSNQTEYMNFCSINLKTSISPQNYLKVSCSKQPKNTIKS